MKTAEEILHQFVSKEYLQKLPSDFVDRIIKSHKEYASQAIDAYSGKVESDCGLNITKDRIRNYHESVKNDLK